MRLALVADLHANLAAVEAVLEEIARLGVADVVCLGDLVGYGAEPGGVLRAVRDVARVVVAGNHDREITVDKPGSGTSSSARRTREWTRGVLDEADLAWLAALPPIAREPPWVAVHGCYLDTTYVNGYVTETMLGRRRAASSSRAAGGVVASWPGDAEAVLVNPGSVGQPRDGDPRAAFAVVDLAACEVAFHRVSYDVEHAACAILEAGLDASLAERLRDGR